MDKPAKSVYDRYEIGIESDAAALLGRKGGKAKVPKGFSMATAAQRTEAAKKGLLKRWGRVVEVTLQIRYLPSTEETIKDEVSKFAKCSGIRQAASLMVYRAAHERLHALGMDIFEVDCTKPMRTELRVNQLDSLIERTKPQSKAVKKAKKEHLSK